MSERLEIGEPSAEIVHIGPLWLQRRARRTRCRDRVCRMALTLAPCEYILKSANPLRKIVRVGAPSLWCRVNLSCNRRTLCGDRACRIAFALASPECVLRLANLLRRFALAVAPRELVYTSASPLRTSCASKRSRCSLWRRADTTTFAAREWLQSTRSLARFPPAPRHLRLDNRLFSDLSSAKVYGNCAPAVLAKSQTSSTEVAREVHSRSSCPSSARRAFAQRWIENRDS